MNDFAAIDFETANSQRTSVCSVGVVVVRDGEIRDTFYSLIRPRPNFYSRFTTAIHGLTYEDTVDALDFAEVWDQVAPRIEGLPLVAHNSPFDEGCLRAVFNLYGMPYPDSTAPAGLRAGSSGGAFPTISSTPSRLPAALTWSTTTTRWPMPRPVPGLHSGSSDPFRCDDTEVPGSSHAGTSGDFSFFVRRLPAADRTAGCSGLSGQSPSSSWNRISQRL